MALDKLKDDLKNVPSWVWLGGAAGIGLLYILGRNSAGTAASTNPLGVSSTPSVTTDTTAPAGTTAAAGSSSDLTSLESYLAQLLSQGNQNLTPSPTSPTQTTTPTQSGMNPNNISDPLVNAGPVGNSIQTLLGPYGGPVVSTSAPYQGLGSSWNDVLVSQFAGGGTVTDLGVAQPRPAVGAVVPPAVQNPTVYNPGTSVVNQQQNVAQAYTYSYGFQPGQTQGAGGGSLASVIQQEIAAGVITQAQGQQSARNSGITL